MEPTNHTPRTTEIDMSNLPIDAFRDSFLTLLKKGMTPLEALREFDRDEWNKAVSEEILDGEVSRNPETFILETQHGKPSLLELGAKALREEMNEKDMDQAIALWLAGWTSEQPNARQTDVMSWYWRAPAKRKNSKGRRYYSTNQAFNAMNRLTKGLTNETEK